MADVALAQEAAIGPREPAVLRWYHDHISTARGFLSFLIVAIVWELAALSGNWKLVVAPLQAIAASAAQLWSIGKLQQHIMTSMTEFAVGYLIAAVIGIGLGLLLATSPTLNDFIEPWISAIYATPTVALAPLFILIFGIDISSKIAVVLLLSFFPIVINTVTGIKTTERVYIEAAQSYCASRGQIFVKVLLPSALPFIVAGLRLGVGRGLIGVVVGELFGARAGLGFLIFSSSQLFDTAGLWLGVFILAGTGILSTVLLQKVERRMAPWREFELK